MQRRIAEVCPFTRIANVTAQPAVALPLAWNAAGLPIGTHGMGRFGDEATLLRLAAQLEPHGRSRGALRSRPDRAGRRGSSHA